MLHSISSASPPVTLWMCARHSVIRLRSVTMPNPAAASSVHVFSASTSSITFSVTSSFTPHSRWLYVSAFSQPVHMVRPSLRITMRHWWLFLGRMRNPSVAMKPILPLCALMGIIGLVSPSIVVTNGVPLGVRTAVSPSASSVLMISITHSLSFRSAHVIIYFRMLISHLSLLIAHLSKLFTPLPCGGVRGRVRY